MRVLVYAALLCLLLTGCGTTTPAGAPSPSPSAHPSAHPSETAAQPARGPVLLPPGCTAADHVRLVSAGENNAGGQLIERLELTSARDCTLAGESGVRAFEADGTPVIAGRTAFLHPQPPVQVGPATQAEAEVSESHACQTPATPTMTAARVTLPGGAGSWRVSLRPAFPDCGPPTLAVGFEDPRGPQVGDYAVPIAAGPLNGPLFRHAAGIWASGDLDGDGRTDTVVLTTGGRLEAHLATGRTLTRHVDAERDGTHLWAVADLDSSGRPEILLGSSALGCCGYFPVNAGITPYIVDGGRLVPIRTTTGRPLTLAIALGHGDFFAGITCGAETLADTTALLDGPLRGPRSRPRLEVTRTTWHISGTTATLTGHTRGHTRADPTMYTATSCPGLDAEGEPTR